MLNLPQLHQLTFNKNSMEAIFIEDKLLTRGEVNVMLGQYSGSSMCGNLVKDGLPCYVIKSSSGDFVLYSRAEVIEHVKERYRVVKSAATPPASTPNDSD